MRELARLLQELFTLHGYRVGLEVELEGRSGRVHAVDLLAEGRDQAIVLRGTGEGALGSDDVAAFAELVADTCADLGVLCHWGDVDPAARAGLRAIVLWDRRRLQAILGELALANAVGGEVDLPLTVEAPAPLDAPVPGPAPAAAEETLPALDLLWDAASEAPSLPAAPAAPAQPPAPPAPPLSPPPPAEPTLPATAGPVAFSSLLAAIPAYRPPAASPPPAQPLPPWSPGKPMLPVRILETQARARVADRLFAIDRLELVLQPVHLFDYECDVLREGSLAYDTQDGRVQVNASDKSAADVDPDLANPEGVSLLPAGHGHAVLERAVRVQPERALELARQFVARKFTRTVEVRIPDHHNSLYYSERRKVEPTPDQVRVVPIGLLLRPVWRLWGSNGHADVDAVDGSIGWAETPKGRTDAMLLE